MSALYYRIGFTKVSYAYMFQQTLSNIKNHFIYKYPKSILFLFSKKLNPYLKELIANLFLSCRSKTLKITAVVTDSVTGDKLPEEEASVRFAYNLHDIKFLENTPTTFKPGMTWIGYVGFYHAFVLSD